MSPALFFPLRMALAILGLLWFHLNFGIISSSSVRNVLGNLIGIVLKSVDSFKQQGRFSDNSSNPRTSDSLSLSLIHLQFPSSVLFLLPFLGLLPWHMEVPRLGV